MKMRPAKHQLPKPPYRRKAKVVKQLPVKVVVKNKKVPMARKVQTEKTHTRVLQSSSGFVKRLGGFFYSHKIIGIISTTIIVILLLVFFTPIFIVQQYRYNLGESNKCLTEQDAIKEFDVKKHYLWEYAFYNSANFLRSHRCLRSVRVGWNLFSFNTISLTFAGENPVVKVDVVRITPEVSGVGAVNFFNGVVNARESWYISANDSFFTLDSPPELFTVSVKVLPGIPVTSPDFPPLHASQLLQLKLYFEKEMGATPSFEIVQDGSVKVTQLQFKVVYLTLQRDLAAQLGSLQSLLAQSTIDKSKVKEIDLRFGNPVIRFE